MIWSRETMDQSYKDIKQGLKPAQVDAVAKQFSKAILKGRYYGCWGDHPKGKQQCTVWRKRPLCHSVYVSW